MSQHELEVSRDPLQVLQKERVLAYTTVEEGEVTTTRLAQLPDDVDSERISFIQVILPHFMSVTNSDIMQHAYIHLSLCMHVADMLLSAMMKARSDVMMCLLLYKSPQQRC